VVTGGSASSQNVCASIVVFGPPLWIPLVEGSLSSVMAVWMVQLLAGRDVAFWPPPFVWSKTGDYERTGSVDGVENVIHASRVYLLCEYGYGE
jgi:hypothetical protein